MLQLCPITKRIFFNVTNTMTPLVGPNVIFFREIFYHVYNSYYNTVNICQDM